MSNQKHTNINTTLVDQGVSDMSVAQNTDELERLLNIVRAGGGQLKRYADNRASNASHDVWVLAPVAAATNTITVVSLRQGHSIASGVKTIEIADAGDDTLAATYTSGAVKISLANTTDSNNTLTLIKAALDGLNTSTNGAVLACFITGTASTQMVHGGTNTVAATAAGGTAAGGLKSSVAGATGLYYLPN